MAILADSSLKDYINIRIEADVARFVDSTYQLDRYFYIDENFDWARKVLTDTDLSGTDKVDRLCNIIHGLTDDDADHQELNRAMQTRVMTRRSYLCLYPVNSSKVQSKSYRNLRPSRTLFRTFGP